jgi:homoserine O-acetyltransferase/O-succinyltransferase
MRFFSAGCAPATARATRRVHVAARLAMALLASAPAARLAAEEAPAQFSVRLDTSKGPVVVEVHREWAPHGADRFHELVRSGYYDDARFFRVVAERWAQFGINGRPEVSVRWRERTIPDDPPKQSNTRGTVAFAFGVGGGRTTQVFINLGDNTRLDGEGFAPFGRVVEGMEAADALFAGYGEASGGGIRGGKQAPLFEGGNAWLARHFPRLDFIRHAEVVPATMPQAVEGDYVIRGFRFASGETLPELKLHYRTLGEPRRGADGHVRNAVLILHGTGGSGRGFLSETFGGRLFGPGQLLDAARYFIVLPDGIGHGGSSKPSDGLHARFPHYTYDDMVVAQHELLTGGLRVDHLVLVMGTSMGGMHTWLWGERYPGFMDGLVPLASAPAQIAGRNRVMRKMLMDAIRDDPGWEGGDYRQPPRRGLTTALDILMLMTSSPLQWHKTAPTRDAADAFLAEQITRRLATTDANDLLYAFDASRDYDPSPGLESIRAPLLAINSADDVVNPPELGLMEKLVPRVPRGRYVLIPTGPETRGHGTHSLPDVWGAHLARFLAEIGDEAAPLPR